MLIGEFPEKSNAKFSLSSVYDVFITNGKESILGVWELPMCHTL